MSNDKNQADVQPGGAVRLGQQAERARFEAWASAKGLNAHIYSANGMYSHPVTRGAWLAWQHLSAQPSPAGQGDAQEWLEAYDQAVEDLSAERSDGWNEDNRRPQLEANVADLRAELVAALAARQPVGQEPVGGGGFVISNGSGEKYMAWGQVGPEWTADRSAALWLVRRADAEALAAENEDAWSILPVERCALPPNGWACTLAAGHEGPCPTIAAPTAQAVDLEQFRPAVCAMGLYAEEPEDVDEAKRLLALIDGKAVGK